MGEFQPGEFINHRYQVVRRLGRGAMGTVYLAEDVLKVHRRVALKVLRSENLDDPDMWSKGEYQALIRLRHPNLARVYDFGRIQGSSDFFIVSEFVRGVDLLTATKEIEHEELLDIIAQVCRALEYIHSQGYVHFDIKPDNILVTHEHSVGDDQGSKVMWNASEAEGSSSGGKGPARVKVIDFGLAEQISGTFDFAIKGTFNYVAPEIIRGQSPDKRADLYSFGVTLHQIVTGGLPFVAEDGKTIAREGNAWREKIRRTLDDQPQYLTDILIKLLEEDPELRFSTAREIIQVLNSGSGQRYLIETAETQASYLYCNRLIGRRKQLNVLKTESEGIFGDGYGGKPLTDEETVEAKDKDIVSRLLDEEGRRRAPLLMVTGEIGVGKSRLVEEFVHFLRMREIPIYVGNCYETTNDPYQPFREIITEAALALGRESELFRKFGVLLRRLCPKLAQGDDENGETGFRPDKDRMYFIDRLANFIIEAANAQPFVMIVNNLHWADESSVELMGYLVQQIQKVAQTDPGPPPLMLITTIRLDEQMSDPMRDFLAEVRDEENVREVMVRRFSRAQIAELIHHMLQIEEISSSFLNRLEERTSGNPLFIVETLKGLQEEGIIHREGDDWKIRGGGDLARVDIPHGLEAILLRRVRVLDSTQQKILDALAVYDKPVSGKFLERLSEFAGVDVLGQLRELENRGMVTKHLDGGRLLFSITQPKLREIVYHHLDEARRRVLHGVIADALSEAHKSNIEEIIEDLAHHYQNSDRSGKALELTIRAGDLSRSIFAHDQALEHFRHVLRQTEGDPHHRRTWLETHEKIGDIGLISCDYELAVASFAILLGLEGCEEFRVLDRSRVLRKRGKIDEIQGEYDNALRSYKAARDLVDNTSGRPDLDIEKIRVYNSMGWVYVCMGKYEKAMKTSVDAQRMITGNVEAREHAMIYSTIGSANFFKGNIGDAIDYHSRALEIRENVEDIPEIVVCLNNLGNAYLANADYNEALKHFEQALSTAEEIGDAFGRAMALHNRAAAELALGRNEVAERFLQDSLKLSRHYRMRFLTNKNYVLRGSLRREADDLAKAEGDLFRAMSVFAKQGNRWGLANCLFEIAEVHLQKDSVEEALKLLHEGLANATSLRIDWLEARGRMLEVRAIRRTPNAPLEQLLVNLEEAKALVDDCRNTEMLAELEQERAEVLIGLKRVDEARAAFAHAEELFRETGDRMGKDLLQNYLRRHQVGTRSADQVRVREIPDTPVVSEETSVLPAVNEQAAAQMSEEQEEMLRLASLLQEAGQGVSSRIFVEKVLTCLVKAVGCDDAFLLARDGDHVRVVAAIDKNSTRVKGASSRICLEALEIAFDGGDPILAPQILDNDRVGGYEALYHNNVKSLGILPIRIEGTCRGAVYLNNPKGRHLTPPHGSAVLASYSNLLSLVLPRMKPLTVA